MSKSCNKSTLLWGIIIAIVVIGVGALIWSNRGTITKDLGSVGGMPVQESNFSWDAKTKEINKILADANLGRDLKSIERNDITGDGVQEIFYETKNNGEFVMLTENPANTPMLVKAYQKFEDKEGVPFVMSKKDADADGITKTYVVDKLNFIIANLEKNNAGKCDVSAYRWEQVKRAMVLFAITDDQKAKYCKGE